MELFRPLAREVATFAESLTTARSATESGRESEWTAERLAADFRTRLGTGRLFVVSNREPVHCTSAWPLRLRFACPPSGLVTALEPVLVWG